MTTAVYKSGTGTSGRVCGDLGLGDARRGTWGHQVWDAGTFGTGTRGRQIKGRRERGMWVIIALLGGKCDISHFPREYVLVKATHPALLRVCPCLFTKRRLGEDPLHRRKWNRCPGLLADGILETQSRVGWFVGSISAVSRVRSLMGCGRQKLCRITAFDSK